MKSLIKNYVSKLTKEKLDGFAKKKDIYLSDSELNFLLDLIKNNNYDKLYQVYIYYKNRYKGYLF